MHQTLCVIICALIFPFYALAADDQSKDGEPEIAPIEPTSCQLLLKGNKNREAQALMRFFPFPMPPQTGSKEAIEAYNLRHRFLARIRSAEITEHAIRNVLEGVKTYPSVADDVNRMTRELLGATDNRQTMEMGSLSELEQFMKSNGVLWSVTGEIPAPQDVLASEKRVDQLLGRLAVLAKWLERAAHGELQFREVEQRKVFASVIDHASALLAEKGIAHKVVSRSRGTSLRIDGFRIEFGQHGAYDPVAIFRELEQIDENQLFILMNAALELQNSKALRDKQLVVDRLNRSKKHAIENLRDDIEMYRQDFYRDSTMENRDRLLVAETELAMLYDAHLSVLMVAQPVARTFGNVVVPAGYHWIEIEYLPRGYRRMVTHQYFVDAENPQNVLPVEKP